ncbi:MAG: hypothetical protein AAFQ82_18340, partial [Myxococcota bacterium]
MGVNRVIRESVGWDAFPVDPENFKAALGKRIDHLDRAMNGIGAPGMTLAQRAAHKDLKNAYVLLRAGSTIKPRPSVFNNPIAKGEYAAELTAEIEALKHAMTR